MALKHSSVGDFTYNPKTGEVSRMKGGGNVPKHKTPSKRTGTGQAWFPKTWSDNQIKEAGEYVARLA